MYDIITIGSATRDLFAKTGAFDVRKNIHLAGGLEGCLPLGAKIDIKDLIFDTGGGATNTGVAFSFLGMKTATVCRLGHDFAGKEIVRILKEAGVETKFITYDKKIRTAYSIVLLTEMGERTILVFRGASRTFGHSSIPWKNLKSRWLYISSLGGNLKLLSQILNIAQKRNIKVGWNPGGLEIKMGLKKLKPLIKKVDVLIMNEEEVLTLLSQKSLSDSPFAKGREPLSSPFEKGGLRGILKTLRLLPRRALAVTMGGKGAMAADKNNLLTARAVGKKILNTTGAGDAFSAGFIAGLWRWNDPSLALRLGILNSGHVVAKMGAKAGLLKRLPSKAKLGQLPIHSLNK
ncbi:MAG: carbohydrate kinase family protein [bacterium]|nr:carbohydrate kinase family protein [bacterium]